MAQQDRVLAIGAGRDHVDRRANEAFDALEEAARVLLVDDLADSGITLRAVVDRLRGMPQINELRSAVIWTKGVSSYTPDYYVEMLATSPWIHQPFEEYDDLRPAGLARKFQI